MASVGGLISGMDTASIVSQLMLLEARPQVNLKSRVSTEQREVNALQTLNAKLASIATKAADLAKVASWSPVKATSSDSTVTTATRPGADPGSVTFQAVAIAKSYQASYKTTGASDDVVMTADTTIKIKYGDGRATKEVNTGNGTLTDIAAALNASGTGLEASLVKVDATKYRLHVQSATTGAKSDFTLTEADGTTAILGGVHASTAGADAEIKVSGEATNLTSTTNTFTDLMPKVDVTLSTDTPLNTDIKVTVERDPQSLADRVKGLVEVVNAALTELASLTASGADAKSRGLLAGDSTLRTVRNRLIESVTGGVDGKTLATYGIQTDKTGKLVFDDAKFKAAYEADPTGTSTMFAGADDTTTTDGFAGKLEALAKSFSDSVTGTVTATIKSRQGAIEGWEDDIADWDIRLAARRTSLERQYTALESALGKLQSQGSWLAGQLAGLPTWSS